MAKVTKHTQAPQTAVAVRTAQNGFQSIDLAGSVIPDLKTASAAPIDLVGDYWTPENPGEERRMYFSHIAARQVRDQETDESVELECAFFVEVVNGEAKSVANGSKRLVAAMVNAKIEKGTPLCIRYLGKKKNSTNQHKSDMWSIKPLMISTEAA